MIKCYTLRAEYSKRFSYSYLHTRSTECTEWLRCTHIWILRLRWQDPSPISSHWKARWCFICKNCKWAQVTWSLTFYVHKSHHTHPCRCKFPNFIFKPHCRFFLGQVLPYLLLKLDLHFLPSGAMAVAENKWFLFLTESSGVRMCHCCIKDRWMKWHDSCVLSEGKSRVYLTQILFVDSSQKVRPDWSLINTPHTSG